jgi:uncharacterized membrane protein
MTSVPYSAILALHLIAVALFAGGLLVVASTLPGYGAQADAQGQAELRRLRSFNLFVVTPALVCVWLLGATLATEAGWFAAPWLQAKIVLVILLSGIHGVQSGRLRRLVGGTGAPHALARWWPLFVAAIAAAIIGLATVKPTLWG